MKIRARRGVCIGVDRHLVAGDLADLETAQVTFLVGIGAVECVVEAPAPVPQDTEEKRGTDAVPAQAGPTDPALPSIEPDLPPASGKSSKKEK